MASDGFIFFLLIIVFFRELLESEESKWRQQAGMEEQLRGLRQGLQDQISAAHNLTAGLQARLDDVQKQVTQVTSTKAKPWHRVALGACFINSKLAGCHSKCWSLVAISVQRVSIENHEKVSISLISGC